MRLLLQWLLHIGRSPDDAAALRGDLDEEYRARIRPSRSWVGAQGWYLKQIAIAAAHGIRDGWRRPSLRNVFYPPDVRFALRRWRRRPGFALTAILTLALGIGATTSIFSVIDAVILRPLPWPEADRLVRIFGERLDQRNDPRLARLWNRHAVSVDTWRALQQSPVFSGVAAAATSRTMTLAGDRPEMVQTMNVSVEFPSLLGIGLSAGRMFSEADGSDAAILTHEAWQRLLGGRRDVVGRALALKMPVSGLTRPETRTVVGILEPGFSFGRDSPDVLLSLRPSTVNVQPIARLALGVSLDQANDAARAIIRAGETRRPTDGRVVSLADDLLHRPAQSLWVLLAGASLLLLVGCANVAGLLFGDIRSRQREIAVRRALGGGTGSIARQFLVEHLLLAGAASALGMLLAVWLTGAVVRLAPDRIPRLDAVVVDARVAAFAVGLGLIAMVGFGIASVLASLKRPTPGDLNDGDRGAPGGRGLGARVVVAGEMAVALVLVVGASLFGETLLRLAWQPLGFDPSGLTVATTQFVGPPEAMAADAMVERLAGLPGVTAAASATTAPFGPEAFGTTIDIPGRVWTGRPDLPNQPAMSPPTHRQLVSRDYFSVMATPILRGRAFIAADATGHAAIVSEIFERLYFDGKALGRRFSLRGETVEVVGVVPDAWAPNLRWAEQGTFYMPLDPPPGVLHFLVRTSGDSRQLTSTLRDTIRGVSPQWIVTSVASGDALFAASIAEERFRGMLSVFFGVAALLLAAIGLAGLALRRVAERRREFGIRLALGAAPADLHRLVLRDAAAIVAAGLLIGLPAALGATRLAEAVLIDVPATASHLFVLASAVLASSAFVAMLVPARRAARVDPALTLKN